VHPELGKIPMLQAWQPLSLGDGSAEGITTSAARSIRNAHTGHFVELAKRVGMQKVEFRHFDS
jgi:hypothetical protein